MKSITIASSNKSLFGLAIDNAKAADSKLPERVLRMHPLWDGLTVEVVSTLRCDLFHFTVICSG